MCTYEIFFYYFILRFCTIAYCYIYILLLSARALNAAAIGFPNEKDKQRAVFVRARCSRIIIRIIYTFPRTRFVIRRTSRTRCENTRVYTGWDSESGETVNREIHSERFVPVLCRISKRSIIRTPPIRRPFCPRVLHVATENVRESRGKFCERPVFTKTPKLDTFMKVKQRYCFHTRSGRTNRFSLWLFMFHPALYARARRNSEGFLTRAP